MRKSRRLFKYGACLVLPFAGLCVWTLSGEGRHDGGVARPLTGTLNPGAVFVGAENPYRDGSREWLEKLFDEDCAELAARPTPAAVNVACRVHRQPFTGGSWVAELTRDLARLREETESQTVESEVLAFVRDVSPPQLLRYLVSSGFIEQVEGGGKVTEDIFYPPLREPPPALDHVPELRPNQFLTRLRTRRPLARPTDVYYLNEVSRDGDCYRFVYSALRNCGDSSHAEVRLAAGQYALIGRDGGVLLFLRSFYSGQSIPPLLDGVARTMTEDFYARFFSTIASSAAGWEPAPESLEWFERLGLRDTP